MHNRWLHRFALLTALATFGLLGLGGLVTSHGVGMAVPDWPNTYGYNMFLFPISKWMGGIFYEHTHRLLAALVGLLTTILALWLWTSETRGRQRWLGIIAMGAVLVLMGIRQLPVYLTLAGLTPVVVGASFYQIYRSPSRPGSDSASNRLRWWGLIAFAAVILQGVLGGLRVVWLKDEIGIFHATLAQLFFVLVCCLTLFTSRWWRLSPVAADVSPLHLGPSETTAESRRRLQTTGTAILRWLVPATAVLILAQLILGATMRHQHAGLAIPDFPLAYGKLWPAMDPDSVARYNQQRMELTAFNPITSTQIALQLAHRLAALVILLGVATCAWLAHRKSGSSPRMRKLTQLWLGLILTQVLLGAATIWSNKAADIATGHVLVGALSLALGALLSTIQSLRPSWLSEPQSPAEPAPVWPPSSLGTQPSPATGLNNG